MTATFGLFLAALLLYLVRKDHLHISHGMGWTASILLCALLGFAPGIFDTLAKTFGVYYAPVLGILLAIAALVIKALMIDIELTQLKVKQQRLTQKLALLESHFEELSGQPPIDD